jgi:hypothetical protein
MGGAFKLEDYLVPTEMVAELQRKQKKPELKDAGRIKRTDAFAIIPLWWAARAVEDAGVPVNLLVCADLVYRAWRAKGKSFVMPNRGGVPRKIKICTLRGLERAGLISVEWRPRKSPIVTLAVSIF